ncbi:hypothetical protein B0H67DRAFT_96433 [Lasiosphaeris hirsuta]|uniref:Zn(2)-C6 fungal-type domain-containing protein n=1 Tax=Lasiosphaeris hirsuta TaxID=260670 RepID=A0AA40BDJ8_9PEZI|nr:hypothetical protein B0H67DRAFT_96433 [Lasiosphaeris hirsuta]
MEAQQQLPQPHAQREHYSGSAAGQLACTQCRSRKLKCDRKRPRCDRCFEKSETCSYPETRHRGLGRRRTVKDLEERIEELEGLLRAANLGAVAHGAHQDLSFLGTDPLPPSLPPADLPFAESPPLIDPGPAAGQLVDLGLFEQFPPFKLVDELTALFFQNIHAGAPLLHQATYSAAVRLPPHMRPPMCLQYIVMASAAATCPAYRHLSEPFYQRARVYAEVDEVRGQGEVFTTVAHVQSWCLISAYECHVYAIFTRASTSLCRAVRIAQMLRMHQLDNRQAADLGSSLPPPRNRIEAEERRRAWWVVFLADRFLACTTGWPSLIDERHVYTNLPSTEEVFTDNTENPYPTPLSGGLDILKQGQGGLLSPFAMRILAANELLHALDHSARGGSNQDTLGRSPNSQHWHRHREIDTNLVALTHLLPESFDVSRNPRNLDAILVHVCTSMALLHLHRRPSQHMEESAARLLPAAKTILFVVHATASANFLATAIRNPLVPFATYMAASVFLSDCSRSVPAHVPGYVPDDLDQGRNRRSEESLEHLANILVSFAGKSPLARANMLQLAADLQRAGRSWLMERILATGEGEGMEGVQFLAGSGGTMVFCPVLSSARGGNNGEGIGGLGGSLGGSSTWGQGRGGGGIDLPSDSYEPLLGGPSNVGLPGAAGPSILQADSPDGLFSQLSAAGLGAFI